MNTRTIARQIERGAKWRPSESIEGLELWWEGPLGLSQGYDHFTIDVGETDGEWWATVIEWNYSYEHGYEPSVEKDLGPFHTIDRAKRRGILFAAREECYEREWEAKMDAVMADS